MGSRVYHGPMPSWNFQIDYAPCQQTHGLMFLAKTWLEQDTTTAAAVETFRMDI